jgi:hypothetical protein
MPRCPRQDTPLDMPIRPGRRHCQVHGEKAVSLVGAQRRRVGIQGQGHGLVGTWAGCVRPDAPDTGIVARAAGSELPPCSVDRWAFEPQVPFRGQRPHQRPDIGLPLERPEPQLRRVTQDLHVRGRLPSPPRLETSPVAWANSPRHRLLRDPRPTTAKRHMGNQTLLAIVGPVLACPRRPG